MRLLSPTGVVLDVEMRNGCAEAFDGLKKKVTRDGSKIPSILARVHRELRVSDGGTALAVRGLILQAAGELLREEQLDRSEPPVWVRQAEQFLTDNLSERIDLRQLSAVTGVARCNVLRAFKRYFNRTPKQYQRDQRIVVATRRLAESNESIARIASDSGFCDQAHFCHEFKKANGCSPREYRELAGVHCGGLASSMSANDF